MKRHLLLSGVKENEKAQVLLEIKSGDSVCIIKTSYFDFSTQLENVKFAMKNYHYTIKII
jgi:transcription antitermination factor NusG